MTDTLQDPISLAQALIRQQTVNPCHDGAQDVLADALESLGFRTKRYPFDGVDNLSTRVWAAQPPIFVSRVIRTWCPWATRLAGPSILSAPKFAMA